MALTPEADQFSQFLRLAFLRSPNYVAGSAGWTINQDGSVEFNNGTFRGSIVGGALYIYTGAGALGNPPQLAAVPAGTTQDPYGNAITSSKILMQANVITLSAGVIRTAATAPLIQLDGNHNAYLEYNAAAALTETIAPVATNDGLGNAVQAGFTAYGAANTTWAQLINNLLQFSRSGFTSKPSITADTSADLTLSSGTTAARPGTGSILLLSTPSTTSLSAIVNGAVGFAEVAAPPAAAAGTTGAQAFTSNTTGALRHVADTNLGDGVNYGIGENVLFNTSATNVPAGAATLTILSQAVAAISYYFRGIMRLKQGATNVNQTIGFTGPSTTNILWYYSDGGQGATTTSQKIAVGAVTTVAIGFAAANDEQYVEFEGTVTFSAAGTFALVAVEGADPYSVQPGTLFIVRPV